MDVRGARRRARRHRATARSTRASARCCATAPTAPRCSTGCAGWTTCSARCCRRARLARADRPAGADRRRRCRWATSCTTATGPATSLLLRELAPAIVDAAPSRRRRGAALHRRQRPLLPQPGDGRRQGERRRGPRRARARRWSSRWRATAPTSASGSPGSATAWFTAPAGRARRPLPGRVRPDGRQPGHRRLDDHRDGRARRVRDGRGAGDRAVRRRRRAPTRSPPPGRCTRSRWPSTPLTRSPGSASAAPRWDRRDAGGAAPGCCPWSTPASPDGWPGTGQVGAGLVEPPAEAFSRRPHALANLVDAAIGEFRSRDRTGQGRVASPSRALPAFTSRSANGCVSGRTLIGGTSR